MTDLVYPSSTAPLLRGSGRSASSEMLPVVDEHGNVIAQASRAYCHGRCGNTDRPVHPVVHLHIIRRDAWIYLQQRSASKRLLPLRWDTAVGGHVSYGEYVMEALYREASEELGFTDFNPFFISSYLYESERERELVNVFAAVGSFILKPDGDEVADGRYWSPEEIEAARGKSILTPNFEAEYKNIKNSLLALL